MRLAVALGMISTAVLGCGGGTLQVLAPDQPVPPSVPRGEISLEVDLAQSGDCEEAFDLAMYQVRAIELIAWDSGRGRCVRRVVRVRYLKDRLGPDELVAEGRKHALRVSVRRERNEP